MTLRSVIIRILYGPTIRRQACFIVTEEILNYNLFYSKEITIEELSTETCNKVLDIREEHVKAAFERMVKNSVVVVAKWNKRIVGHAILKPDGQISECTQVWKNKNYIHYCYVDPKYRGRNIYPYMLVYLAQRVFKDQAKQQVYISADYKNYSSIRGIHKAGFYHWANLTEFGWGRIVLFYKVKIVQYKK